MRVEEFDRKLEQMIDAAATGYGAAVRDHMPDCLYRDFCLWGVSRHNPHRSAVMQMTGALQMAKMTTGLLVGLTVGEADWQRLLSASMTVHAWATLEVVSDNLAKGLARHKASDLESDATRRALLNNFNMLMAGRLKNEVSAASARAALSNSGSEGVSLFHQHLSPLRFRSLAETFINEKGGALSEIEYAARPHLIANIEISSEVVGAVEVENLRPLVRDSLIARYEGVNKLFEPDELSPEEILDASTYTILVITTLGYYVSAIIDSVDMESRLKRLIDNGTLAGALYDAAFLVRLQNDIGTGLLTCDNSTRLMFIHKLVERSREREGEALVELLVRTGRDYALLNRVWKDACLGEFNVCLSGIGQDSSSREALTVFGQRLALCAKAYSIHQAKLSSESRKISDALKDDRVSQIILRFVRFHEQLYDGHYHDKMDGDYAVY